MKTLALVLALTLCACAADTDGPVTLEPDTETGQLAGPTLEDEVWSFDVAVSETDVVIPAPGGGCPASLGSELDLVGMATTPVISQWFEVPCGAIEDLGDAWGLTCDARPPTQVETAEASLVFVIDKLAGTGEVAHIRRGTWVGGDEVPFEVDCAVIYSLAPRGA